MATLEKQPFVGPRPFSRDEVKLFFGRDREARELRSLIIAHPVVLLYAPSGAGKSSLLNASVIPTLEEQGYEVLPPARVSGHTATALGDLPIKNQYAFNVLSGWFGKTTPPKELAEQDLPGMLAQRPHPTDEMGTPVLRIVILDQFEELFTFAPEHWREREDLFNQLSAALEADPLLRIVLAMREDYIANLDRYAHLLPQGLRTRFHLDPLGPEAALQAVEGPLQATHKTIKREASQQLVDELLKMRVKDANGELIETAGPFVEPVQLQVVCQKLWAGLPEGVNVIDESQLETFAGVDDALREFYENALQTASKETGVKEDALRAWVDTYLITPGGTRGIAYRGETLTGRGDSGIPNPAVDALVASHLIHAEVRAGGERWYELTHDRFIVPVQNSNTVWKNFVLRRQRIRNRLYIGLGVVGSIMLIALAVGWMLLIKDREYQRAEGQVDALVARAQADPKSVTAVEEDAVLANVAGYLWQRGRKGDLERLITLLQRDDVQQIIPETSPYDRGLSSAVSWVPSDESWPIEVSYNPDRNVNGARLLYQWRNMATNLAWSWGIPAPTTLLLTEDNQLPKDEIRIRVTVPNSGSKRVITSNLTIPSQPGFVLVTEKGMEGKQRLKQWFDKNKVDWIRVEALEYGGPWYFVPVWTRPILEAAGQPTNPRESAVAVAVANSMVARPELVLNRHNVALRLQQLHKQFPQTVDEALAARGIDGLVEDLSNLVIEDYTLIGLEHWLDMLSTYPLHSTDSASAVKYATGDSYYYTPEIWVPFSGPRPKAKPEKQLKELTKAEHIIPYRDIQAYFGTEPPVRVYVGDALIPLIATPDDQLQPDINEGLIDMRGELYKRFGYVGASVRFRSSVNDPAGKTPDNAFRIEVLNQRHNDDDPLVAPIQVKDMATAKQQIFDELRKRYLLKRSAWLTPEYIQLELNRLPKGLRNWLGRHYSLTDIKILLRDQLAPSEAEIDAYTAGELQLGISYVMKGQTIRDLDSLLGSLVFWSQVDKSQNIYDMAVLLQDTQAAYLSGKPRNPTKGVVADQVKLGLTALYISDDPKQAEQLFRRAVAQDKRQATKAFLENYALYKSNVSSQRTAFLDMCTQVPISKLPKLHEESWRTIGTTQRMDLEDFLAHHGDELQENDRASLEYCLLQHYAAHGYKKHIRSSISRMSTPQYRKQLSAAQQFSIGYWMLDLYGHSVTPPENLNEAEEWLSAAMQKWPADEVKSAEGAFLTLYTRYSYFAPPWYNDMLERIGGKRKDSFWIRYDLGSLFASGRTVEDTERALPWFKQAQELLATSIEEQQRANISAWLEYSIAKAYQVRAGLVEKSQRRAVSDEAIHLLASLKDKLKQSGKLGDEKWPGAATYDSLVSLHIINGDTQLAEQTLNEALQQEGLKNNQDLNSHKFLLSMAHKDMRETMRVAKDLYDHATAETRPDALFRLSLIQLLTNDPEAEHTARQFLEKTHPYNDYIRLTLYWRLALAGKLDQARAYLDERWRTIDPSSWERRIDYADAMVWREQLIGYYLGKVKREQLMQPLESLQAFKASGFSRVGIHGLTFEGMRAEAHFYDALLQRVSGDPDTRVARYREALQLTRELGRPDLYEYQMAGMLLAQ